MLIVIPAYNEGQNVGEVVRGCLRYGRVLVVDDGSTDCTAQASAHAGADVMVHGKNQGYCASLRDGYIHTLAKGHDYLVQLDADGQHDPKYIPEIAQPVRDGQADITIGSRWFSPYPVEFPKAVGILFFRMIVQRITGGNITDTTSGFQCLNMEVIKYYLKHIFPLEYPDANVVIKLHRAGFRIKEVPVEMKPNQQGRAMHRGARKIARYMGLVLGDIYRTVTNE